jgi:predicted RNase H-like HicB family nuclease
MQYTVFISETLTGQWQATVPVLPNCTAEAPTREAVLERIKNNLAAIPNVEALQIEVETNDSQNGHLKKSVKQDWPGFGSHPNDPDWGGFFDELDRQRQ